MGCGPHVGISVGTDYYSVNSVFPEIPCGKVIGQFNAGRHTGASAGVDIIQSFQNFSFVFYACGRKYLCYSSRIGAYGNTVHLSQGFYQYGKAFFYYSYFICRTHRAWNIYKKHKICRKFFFNRYFFSLKTYSEEVCFFIEGRGRAFHGYVKVFSFLCGLRVILFEVIYKFFNTDWGFRRKSASEYFSSGECVGAVIHIYWESWQLIFFCVYEIVYPVIFVFFRAALWFSVIILRCRGRLGYVFLVGIIHLASLCIILSTHYLDIILFSIFNYYNFVYLTRFSCLYHICRLFYASFL